MDSDAKPGLEDVRPSTKLKLALLWTSVMFLYVYGDYFNMYTDGKIEAMSAGTIGPLGEATEGILVAVSIMMAIPSMMVALSLLLPAGVSRWLNVVFGVAYSIILALTMPGAPHFYILYGVLEIALTLTIAWTALRWPRGPSSGPDTARLPLGSGCTCL